ncbi:transposase [Sinorhizobium meliloti]|uniref:SyrB1 regulator n=1 Tax=Sinorhizobium meliloti (strain SM11) TaxID=707241 RepID=F7XBR7_SINMM|nr:transposase [Sinorhizobium meliloti]AEH81289.1 SyrB1 regulator [Sinorhizobium meliloti SM11]ARS67176.1 transcriptional regulator [Sinorhizobium meliloti RU11/001]ASP69598.1 transcriptional regulator [Sinorhizobium meliloti]MBP2470785.1 putative transposase [Sinorhizobium meliloti]MDE3763850.1 transposase [Sinorhizobium meliloti]
MADESNTGPVAAAVEAGAEVKAPTAKKLRSPRPQKAAAEPARPKAPAAKPRRYSEQERNDKLKLIETQVSEGNTLKNAIQSAGIPEQTYYHWKGAAKISAQKDDKATEPLSAGDELADLVELEAENQKLRKRLAEKLRGENAELRKRLGLD